MRTILLASTRRVVRTILWPGTRRDVYDGRISWKIARTSIIAVTSTIVFV